MDSDYEIFLTQNTVSQEAFSPEFNLEELLGDFRKVSDRDSVEVEKKENPGRNIVVVCDNEVEKRRESRIPANTKVNTSWAVRCWEEWAVERNVKVRKNSSKEKYYEVNPDIKKVANEQLDYWLGKFVLEIRKKKEPGSVYPPNTLYQMCCGLQRFLRDNGRPGLNVFEDPKFKHFQDCLDAEMKRLTNIGIGSTVKQAEPLREDQEQKLWNLGLLGEDSPSVLLNTMGFLIGKNFPLRSGREHRNLKFSQLTLVPGTEREPEKLVYVSFGEKNNLGGLKHRNVGQKRNRALRQ